MNVLQETPLKFTSNIRWVVVALAILLLALVVIVSQKYKGDVKGPQAFENLTVAVQTSKDSETLYVVDAKNKTLIPLTIEYQNMTLPVAGIATDASGDTYYLAQESASSSVSNLYKKSAGGQFSKLTNSNTIKSNLSFGGVNNLLVYQAQDPSVTISLGRDVSRIVSYSLADSKETTIFASGENPLVLQNNVLVFQQGNSLRAGFLSNASSSALLTVRGDSVFAIDAVKNMLVSYNTVTKKLDYFAIQQSGFLGYLDSENAPAMLGRMAYSNGILYTEADLVQGSAHTLYFNRFNKTVLENSITVAAPSSLGQILYLYTYE
jgi:hypothetical protein